MENPQVRPSGQKRYPALPDLAGYTKGSTKGSESSLAPPPETPEPADVENPSGEQASGDDGFRKFCLLFPGRVDDDHLAETRAAWDAALERGFVSDEIIGAFACAKRAYLEDPGKRWEPYRFPLYWLTRYDGLDSWIGPYRKQRSRQEFRERYSLDIPVVEFLVKGFAEGYALWVACSETEQLGNPGIICARGSSADHGIMLREYAADQMRDHPGVFAAHPRIYAVYEDGHVDLVEPAAILGNPEDAASPSMAQGEGAALHT